MSWMDPQFFWMYHVFCRLFHPALFRGQPGPAGIADAMAGKGRATKIEHEAMVRGMMIGQEHRFLEWSVEDGWGPLCEFLGKDVPAMDFPRVNDTEELNQIRDDTLKATFMRIVKRLFVVSALSVGLGAIAWRAPWSL